MDPRAFARFWSKVKVGQPHECWPYLAGLDPDGYGIFNPPHGVSVRAHRFAFRCCHGRDADPSALHRCHNRACCNPLHLYEGTARDNIADCIAAGNYTTVYVPGERHPNAKLTAAQIAEVRALLALGSKQKDVAARYGVTPSLISMIHHNKVRVAQ